MKRKLIVLLLVLVCVCSVSLAACNGDAQNIVNNILFEKDGSAVFSEFTLDAIVAGKTVVWTSNNDAIQLELNQDKTQYVAHINFPESETVTVTLTVTLGKASKTFTVKVNPITVDDIADEYIFPKNGSTVVESFDLDSTAEYQGKTATITWSVNNANHQDLIEVQNGKCVVTPSSLKTQVEITATFSYNNQTATRNFRFTVSMPMSHLEEIDYWYSNTGVGRDLKGYVVAIAEAYPKYEKFISFYLLDEEKNAGYYIYRLDIGANNQSTADQIVPGVYMEISGKQNTLYNGLYETTNASGATWKIDDSKKINVEDYIYAIDNDVLSGSPAERRHTGTLVSLTNWTVKSVASEPDTSGKKAALILTKGGKDVAICTSKYMASSYTHDGSNFDEKGQAIANLCKTYKVGDTVSVTGILSYYAVDGQTPASTNGIQILPRSVDDVKVGTADPAGKEYDGTKVGAIIAKINETIATNKLNGKVVSNKNVVMPASENGVTVTYSLCSASNAVTLKGTTFQINPVKNEKVNVRVDLTCNDYTTTIFFAIQSQKMSDQEIADAEKNALKLEKEEISKAGSIALPTKGSSFENVTISWALKEASTVAEIEEGKLVVSALPAEKTTIVLVATIACGDATATDEIEIIINAAPTQTVVKADINNLQENKAYKLVIDQTNRDKRLYVLNAMNGHYVASTDDLSAADDIYVEKVEGGVRLYFKNASGEKNYLGAKLLDGFKNIKLDEASVWTVTADCIKTNIGTAEAPVEVYIGTYGTYSTFSVSTLDKLSTSFAAYLAEVTDVVEEETAVKADINNLQENKAYKLVIDQTNLEKRLYVLNTMNGYYVASTDDLSLAADIYVEKVEGGVRLYFKNASGEKNYLGAKISGEFKNIKLDEASVWTVTADCIKTNIGTAEAPVEVYIGTHSTYKTFSVSTLDKLSGSFAAYLAEVGGTPVPPVEQNYTVSLASTYEHATVTFDGGKTSGKAGETISFTVEGKDNYTVTNVLANGTELVASDGKYTLQLTQNVTITIVLADPSGTIPGSSVETPFTVEEARAEADKLKNDVASSQTYYVKGIIVSTPVYKSDKNSYTFEIASSKESNAPRFKVYSCKLGESVTSVCVNDEIVAYGYLKKYNTDLEITYNGNVDGLVVVRTAGTSTISYQANENADIALSATSGLNGEKFTFTVTAKNGANIVSVTVNGEEVKAVDGSYTGTIKGNTIVEVAALIPSAGPKTATVDLTANFGDYSDSWGKGYSAQTVSASNLGVDTMALQVVFSNISKQTGTITNMPVAASKSSAAQYVTISVAGMSIKSVTFNLKEWSSSKTFKTINIEYTTDGTTWTATNVGFVNGTATAIGTDYATLSATELPANVSAVRLVILGSSTSNNQVGIAGFTVVAE